MKLGQQIPAQTAQAPLNKPASPPVSPSLMPAQAAKLQEIKIRAGWIPPSQAIALAKGNATTKTIDAVATMNAKRIIDEQGSEDDGNWLDRNVYDRLKATTRWGFAGLNFVPEFVQGGVAQFSKPGDTLFQDGWFNQTTFGSMLQNPELKGEGFFASQDLMNKQAERARKYRGTIDGSAWTVGRGAANLVFKPKSLPYNIMSGVLDALVMIKTDPTGVVTKGAKLATKGGLVLGGIDEATGAAKVIGRADTTVGGAKLLESSLVPRLSAAQTAAIRQELADGVGLTKGLAEYGLDGTKYAAFSQNNRRFVTLVDRIVEEKSATRIAEDIFDHKLPNEIVSALADANDPDVVRAILATGWDIGGQALPQDIRNLQGVFLGSRTIMGTAIGDIMHERMPLVDGLRKSRYFTKMAKGSIVTSGTSDDNRNAVRSVISYLRTAGVDAEEVDSVANMVIRGFQPGSSDVARKQSLDVFEATMRSVMKRDGITDEVIDELFGRARGGVERVRKYLADRDGLPTDNGYSAHILNKNQNYLPDEEIETLLSEIGYRQGDKYAITSPTEIVEMLDRIQVLPDLRDVRRITRNKLFREVLDSGVLPGKLPLTGKRAYREVTTITDQKEFDRLGSEIKRLKDIPNKTQDTFDEIDDLVGKQNVLKIKERKKVVTAEQRGAIEAIDYVQNKLWKPLALATGGYIVRNSLDAQVRMAFSELPSLFTHPYEYINLVLGTSNKMSLKLENLSRLGTVVDEKTLLKLNREVGDLQKIAVRTPKEERRLQKLLQKQTDLQQSADNLQNEALEDLAEQLGFGLRQQGIGADGIEEHMRKTGTFTNVSRADSNGLELHTDAVAQNGYRSHNDVLRKIATQTFVTYGEVTEVSRTQAARKIVNTILKDKKLRKQIYDLHEYGFEVTNARTGLRSRTAPVRLADLPEDEVKTVLLQYAYRIPVENAQILTGNLPEVTFMYAFNRVPRTVKGRIVPTLESKVDELVNLGEGPLRVGTIVQISDNEVGVVTKFQDSVTRETLVDPDGDGVLEVLDYKPDDIAIVQPIENGDAFGSSGNGSRSARQLIQKQQLWDAGSGQGLSPVLKRELSKTDPKDAKQNSSFQDSYDDGVEWFFSNVYGTITRKLERSPVFREFYYQEVNALVDRLNPEDAQKFLDRVTKAAKEAKTTPEKYVGNKEIIARMKASVKTGGDVTLDELDEFAKVQAVTRMKELLYDASERSNLQDALRIIMPFAPAWKEVLGTYAGFFKSNPIGSARQFQRIYTGIGNADPDNDGRGFFYKDPTTNKLMFTFPGSGTLSKALTGLDATLEAPVTRLSQGIQAFPALGPMAQIAASQIIPDVPETDFMVGVLLPYGRKSVDALVPGSYLQKFAAAAIANEDDVTGIYANTYIETMRALSATGEYDLSSKQEVEQLQRDAKFKARILTAFRALSQFAGPTAGTTEFKVPTDEGDQFMSALVKEFYDMQADPTIGYDKALPQFLAKYGDEMALYVSSKSRTTVEGLEATAEFGDWERDNKGLIKAYPDVARYLAPAGSDFNFTVWDRQRRTGLRVTLTDNELIELAQQRIGSAKFRYAREQIGPYPSAQNKELLKRYRLYLSSQYPGFPAVAEFEVGKYYNDVSDLKKLVFDERVVGDVTAEAIKKYLLEREQAIVASGVSEQGFRSARAAEPFRDQLASIGLALSKREPNFARIFDRLLASEVE
jgi:hypothetical protein